MMQSPNFGRISAAMIARRCLKLLRFPFSENYVAKFGLPVGGIVSE
jgi:hypothetical protein